MAAVVFSLTHLALPMIVDGDEDFMNAMISSYIATSRNKAAMLIWATLVFGALAISIAVWFPLVALLAPLAFHGSWHVYRSVVSIDKS